MLKMTDADKEFFQRIEKSIHLDDEQKAIILNDDKYVYVVAGAGSGKSTVLSRKIQYLIEVKNVNPEEILVLSYSNKSVDDLQNKVNETCSKPVDVETFHAEGLHLYLKETGKKYKAPNENSLKECIKKTFSDVILKDENLTKSVMLFFSSYMYVPFKNGTIDSYLDYLKTEQNKFVTLQQDIESLRDDKTSIENVRMESKEEVDIANFLYLHGVNYEYEVPYITNFPDSGKVYVPDFKITQGDRIIYLEHYGVSEDGQNTRFSDSNKNLYNQHIKDKRELHKKNNTELIENYSVYNDKRSYLEHLEEDLINKGIIFNKRDEAEVLEKLIKAKKSKYLSKLYELIAKFITNFYEMGYDKKDFAEFIQRAESNNDERTLLFLKICKTCLDAYEKYLTDNEIIDFCHMIKNSTELLNQGKPLKYFKNIKYIIIDEYQDISKSRVDFVKAMATYCNSKVIAVGDDWQAIYRFAGSDIKLFTDFEKYFPGAKRMLITHTYRNSQELIDIAGKFIMKNEDQIKKQLISSKSITDPIKIFTYECKYDSSMDYLTNEYKNIGKQLLSILEEIKNEYKDNCPPVLVLGRTWSDGENLNKSDLFEYKQKTRDKKKTYYLIPKTEKISDMTIVYSTVHSAKGLGYENVILLNCKDDVYGFPSRLSNDPIINFLIPHNEIIEYAEERRLFYVAMTRTKNRFYIITPYDKASDFLLELLEDNKSLSITGTPLIDKKARKALLKCPDCGAPLIFQKNTSLELPLWICSNTAICCGFVTNRLCAQHLRIKKCECGKGYLIVKLIKKMNADIFELNDEIIGDPENPKWYKLPCQLGCTEYKENGKGCNHVEKQIPANFIRNMI